MNTFEPELIGIIMGDGNLWTNNRKYEITITGNPKDKDYLDKINNEMLNMNFNPYYRKRGRGLRLTVYSKRLFEHLTKTIGLKHGKEKNTTHIPNKILENRESQISFVRGLFDTDGSVFTSNKGGIQNYPTIEITNENKLLLDDVKDILCQEGFRVNMRKSNSNTYKLAMAGYKMIDMWKRKIGSSHPRKEAKIDTILKRYC